MQPLSIEPMMVFEPSSPEIVNVKHRGPKPGLPLATRPAHAIKSYRELLSKLAALRYYNRRYRLLYRGQNRDWNTLATSGESGRSSLYPSILRYTGSRRRKQDLARRFELLRRAEQLLLETIREGAVHKHRIVRWALIQHYEVAPTPLFDLTSSIERALAFAFDGAEPVQNGEVDPHLFVFAFPQLTGPISVSAESETQVVDLTQVCPPQALRPHFQDALLAGDYPVVDSVAASHGGRGAVGNSFACRLIGKFKLVGTSSWPVEGLQVTPRHLLYPDRDDEWYPLLASVRERLKEYE